MAADSTRETSRLFGALSHRYRRIVLYYLREHETATLDVLVDLVTGWVQAGPGPDESVDHAEVRAQLHHVHLPTLDSAALVEYDPDAGTVSRCEYSAAAGEILDAALESDTTGTRLDVRGVLAAAEEQTRPRAPGEAACGPEDDAGRDGSGDSRPGDDDDG
ncbi:DUF7344 domain-containing protein [Halosimplex amylolyticum]|uniref:DUF7344 domain-containing protein n=1 Tax=Halosimplex amylolyticum TaxID=3396616 RepID=UPI003F54C843